MAYESIAEPGRIGGLEVKNRIALPPMEKNWCDRLGNPTRRFIDYYAERARRGVGMINFEATYVDARGRGNLFQLGLWHDDNIDAHRRLNDAVREHGCRTASELNHGGRNCNTHRTGLQPVGPSNQPLDMVGGHQLKELSVDDIAAVVRSFRDGASRAKAAGYDMITIHGAHGYLITSFLSHLSNQRTDRYGGSDENRWRFAIEVYEAIREEVGGGMPVGIRISAEEDVEGGYRIESTIGLVKRLESLGLDYVDVSTGLYESIETLIQPMDMEQGCLLPHSKRFKSEVSIPVLAAGRIDTIDVAEAAVSRGDCDFAQMGRAFHADAELLEKTLGDRKDEVVRCIACNKCCMELFVNKPSVCTVNVDAGREGAAALVPAAKPKKVMVAGGGMAGMEAARIAALRGHDVTLFEASDRLGGWLNVLATPATRSSWSDAISDRTRMCESAGVRIVKQRKVTAAVAIQESPDALVVATGTRPFIPKYVPGISEDLVTDYDDLIGGRVEPGSNAVVAGGQQLGMAAAEFLAAKGATVTIVEATGAMAADLEFMAQKMLQSRIGGSNRINVRLNTNIEEIFPDGVLLQSGGAAERLENVDQVVIALERDMNRDLIEEIAGPEFEGLSAELHTVGDCVWPGEPYDAILSGNAAGRII